MRNFRGVYYNRVQLHACVRYFFNALKAGIEVAVTQILHCHTLCAHNFFLQIEFLADSSSDNIYKI